MAAITALKAGDVLYTVTRQKMGNVNATRQAVHQVRVIEVDTEKGRVLASWNGNAARTFTERQVAGWRRSKPKTP